MSNRLRIIGLCALFNILFEYSARGVTTFSHKPVLFLAMFGIYFTCFAMIEDLIVRFKLSNYQLALVACFYGFFPEMFLTGNLFNRTTYFGIIFFGVNVGTVVFINILSWGIMQSIVTFYFANRIQVRDWNHPKMGKVGWGLCIGYQFLVAVAAWSNPVRPRGTLLAFLTALILIAIVAALFIRSLSRREGKPWHFESSLAMDVCAFGSVILFLVLGTFVQGPKIVTSQPLNHGAVVLENLWVLIVGIIYLVYRWNKGSDVTV